MTCLTSKHTGDKDAWGCLSSDNLLFQIRTLEYTRIPDWVVDQLIEEDKIELEFDGMTKGYYQWKYPVKNTDIVLAPEPKTELPIVFNRRRREPLPVIIVEEETVVPKEVVKATGITSIMQMLRKKETPNEGQSRRRTM